MQMKIVSTVMAIVLTGATVTAAAVPATADPAARDRGDGVLREYAADTWRSFTAMLDERTNLPADNIGGDLDPATRSEYTSPTNIGAYLWSTVVAGELKLIRHEEVTTRLNATLDTLGRLSRHEPSGMYFNWYDPATGDVVLVWPEDGRKVEPFLSSVDNGWLAAALMVVRNAEPSVRDKAQALLSTMDFGYYYNADARGEDFPAGLIRGGFYPEPPEGCSVPGNYRGETPDVYYTCNHYDILDSEPRIASYIGIALGQIPREHYFGPNRTFPDSCDWSWLKQRPVGEHREYLGVPVYEGTYEYRGLRFVPTWGGDVFEALMPDLFVPETTWGRNSWGRSHPAYIRGMIEHGMIEADYGYWGFSPASNPFGGYSVYGAPPLGMDPAGYPSDVEGTKVDYGFGDCRPAGPPPASWGDGVVTPHAVFLSLPYAHHEALANLAALRKNFATVYGAGGFKDSVAVRSGTVADRYLSLDQGMVLGAIGNVLARDLLRANFVKGEVTEHIRPLLEMEEFSIPADQLARRGR
jgi:hypothetical protein